MGRTLYTGGTIHTLEDGVADAVLVEDGVVREVGDAASMLASKSAGTIHMDLDGAILIPAFIDAHSHITAYAATLGAAALGGARDFADIAGQMRAFLRKSPVEKGQWLIGFGYDQNTLDEKRHPTRELLDGVSQEIPVIITHASGHMGVANSAALAALGIGRDTPDPAGGVIGRDNIGEPNGYLEEAAFSSAAARVPQPTLEQRLHGLERAQREYLRHGVATIQDGFTKAEDWELLRAASDAGMLKADVVSYLDLKGDRETAQASSEYIGRYKSRLKIGGYKIFLDGSPQGRTAWMTRPYENATDGYRGYPAYDEGEVRALMETSLRDKMQIIVHCNGDAAAAQMIAAYAAARQSLPDAPDIRPVMIHAQLLRRDQLPDLARLNIIASFFIAHTYYWGDTHLKNFGPARAGFISPAGSARREGVRFTFHQDTPVLEPDMLRTIQCAVERVTSGGVRLAASESVSAACALRAVTSSAAYQYFEESSKGSIRAGKRADFTVLDRDPLAVPPDEISGIRVLKTIKDGEVVYSA